MQKYITDDWTSLWITRIKCNAIILVPYGSQMKLRYLHRQLWIPVRSLRSQTTATRWAWSLYSQLVMAAGTPLAWEQVERRTITVSQEKKRSNQQHSWLQGQVWSLLSSNQLFPQALKDNFLYNEVLNHPQIIKMPRPQQDSKPQPISHH